MKFFVKIFILIFILITPTYGFFSKDVILNCEPKESYFKDTYKKIKYFKFNKEGESNTMEFEWSPEDKKFLKKIDVTSFEVREEFYKILIWDYNYYSNSKYRYREIYYIDRVKGTLKADMDRLEKSVYKNKISKYRDTTFYKCKKINKYRLPKKNIKQKF